MRLDARFTILAAAAVALSACGPRGDTGPTGPTGPAGSSATVVYGSTAGTACEGDDPRLSDARTPLAGSPDYVQNGTTPQAANLNVTGTGTFGGAVTGQSFTGSGAGLTALPAANLAGTIPDAALPPDVPLVSGNNAFVGSNSFAGLGLGGQPITNVGAPQNATDAATKGYVDAATGPIARTATYFAEQIGAPLQVLGTTWTALPGVQVTFAASVPSSAVLAASGSVLGVPGASSNVGTCGFRFVVDGVPYGDATWGDRLIQCGAPGTTAPGWCSWTMQRVVTLAAGSHAIAVQQVGYSPTAGCQSGGGSYSDAKLLVSTY